MYNLIEKSTGNIISTMSQQVDCWQVREGIAEWVKVSEETNKPQIIIMPVDEEKADMWEAILALSSELEAFKGGK